MSVKSVLLVVFGFIFLTSCAAVRLAGDTVVFAGKVAKTAVTTTGAVVTTVGKVGNATVKYFAGARKVKLQRRGSSYYVDTRINRHKNIRLLLDTGATNVQISRQLALRLGLDLRGAEVVPCRLADGRMINAQLVNLSAVKIGRVEVNDVSALVFEQVGGEDGLLGMSFLDHFVFQIDPQEDMLILRHKN